MMHLVALPAPDAGLLAQARARVVDLTWLGRDAIAAGLLAAAEKVAPGSKTSGHLIGFGGCRGRFVAIADSPEDLHMLLDDQHGDAGPAR